MMGMIAPTSPVIFPGEIAAIWSGCRLSIDGNNPTMQAGSSQPTLYLVPFKSDKIIIWDGVKLRMMKVGYSEVSIAASSLSTVTYYHIYAYIKGSKVGLEASTTAPTYNTLTGQLTKTGDPTRLYHGCVWTDSTPNFGDQIMRRTVGNYYHPIQYCDLSSDGDNSWNCSSTSAWEPINQGGVGATNWIHKFVSCYGQWGWSADLSMAANNNYQCAIARDSTSTPDRSTTTFGYNALGTSFPIASIYAEVITSANYHYLQGLQLSVSGTAQAYGDNGSSTPSAGTFQLQSGMRVCGWR